MKTTSKVRKKKAVPEPRMSNVQKPPRYTLEGWQLALRHQQAVKEPLSVEEAGEENAPGLKCSIMWIIGPRSRCVSWMSVPALLTPHPSNSAMRMN